MDIQSVLSLATRIGFALILAIVVGAFGGIVTLLLLQLLNVGGWGPLTAALYVAPLTAVITFVAALRWSS